ncbi:hypothetical protein CAPTEDRAFT_191105, partial [Capitella teleta]
MHTPSVVLAKPKSDTTMAELHEDHYAMQLDACLETYTDTDEVFSPPVDSPDGKGATAPMPPPPLANIKDVMTRTDSSHSNLSQATSGDVSDLPSPLLVAIEDFDTKAVDQLIVNGLDIKNIGQGGMNAGHYLFNCYCRLHPADQVEVRPKLIDILQVLLKNDLDITP